MAPPTAVIDTAGTRLAFETLIADTSAALMAATARDVDTLVDAALERLRDFFAVDRVGLLAVSTDRASVRVSHAAYAPGIARVPPSFEFERLFPWAYRRAVVEQQPIVLPRIADLPPAAAADRAAFEHMGTCSHMTVPITSGRLVTHVVTLGAMRTAIAWPLEYVPRVRLLGEMVVGALARIRVLEDLRATNDELRSLRERTEQENVYLRREIAGRASLPPTAGRSAAIRRSLSLASQVAVTDATVLLTGETGTGKDRLASYIHAASARGARHMVRVNCAAIPTALIESELFGREKGAYTGALTRQIGRFELAHGSTLFLDEIGELPLDVQVKLLRVLQERTIERLGSPTPVPVDVRIIAATNRDLAAAVRAGTFRADLYYRINVFPIVVPPLRDRLEDLPGLVEVLVDELSTSLQKRFTHVDRASLDALARYAWPGNIRELRNVLERAMILANGPVLTVDPPAADSALHHGGGVPSVSPPSSTTPGGLVAWERDHILRVLGEVGWRIRGPRGAAEVLGLKPTTLEKRMARLDIVRPSARRSG